MIRINEVLLSLLANKRLKQFTTIELKKKFIKAVPQTQNKEASQLIHRTMRKLSDIGFLEKHIADKKTFYIKTSSFDVNRLIATQPRKLSDPTPLNKSPQLQKLKATLNQYQIDLLGRIGEAEEFKRLFDEYANAKALLYPHYMHARNQSSTLVGNIRAIETYINALEG
ncbi:hypothetical protein HQQ94_02655 [Shewanella sp. VB17]|uniref:hypothetical protein n=1 Tax=Shewanella sp. VB17 TaxID=2739432 RepID=UPI0015644519|nr:hypothetical protein [Shewanella sp. VB17]NRD72155.1 hypothetical protein [Shewanella sp. VB17]